MARYSCPKHPKHRQSAGVCSMCLRERLSKISTSSSRAVTNVSSSSSASSVSSAYSSHCSSNAQSHIASPMHSYRNPRKTNYDLDGVSAKGYISLLEKSRSMAFVSEKTVESGGKKKKGDGFWSKLMKVSKSSSNTQKRSSKELEGSSSRSLMSSRKMRGTLNKWG